MRYQVIVYVNVSEDGTFFLRGIGPKDPIAKVGTFQVDADTPEDAAHRMWPVGNKINADDAGTDYPRDVRSLSVGDLLSVSIPGEQQTFLAVTSDGWRDIPEPTNPIVPLEGTWATSRGRV